jgi:response regulator RpfG family c-di-GMP phosphodiesterase
VLKILIVDDEVRQLESLEEMLRREFDVIVAGPQTPVRDALEHWQSMPDLRLAIVDLNMPREDAGRGRSSESVGFELIEQLKGRRPNARIAVHSGYQTHENLTQTIKCRADAFIGKDWKRDEKLDNVHFLWSWVAAASALQTLSRSMQFREPFTAGHSARVREYCRAIVMHFNDATPTTFDLAACLAAAELHDLGMLDIPDEKMFGNDTQPTFENRRLIERHIDAAKFLEELGPGFKKVAEIVREHRRWYKEPAESWAIDYPKDASLPRGDRIRLETRVLALANAIDILATDRPFRRGLDIDSLRAAITELGQRGAFDPKVVAAFERLKKDAVRFNEIYQTGKIVDQGRLRLHFSETHFTIQRLESLLANLEDVILMSGRAVDRLTVERVERHETENKGTHEITVTLTGWANDINEAREILAKRTEEAVAWRGNREMPEVLQRALRSIPLNVE